MSDRRALYVRLPAAEAERLDRAAFERKVSKQDLVADLVSRHLDAAGAAAPAAPAADAADPRRVTVELPEEGLAVGHHDFRPAPPGDVLTVAEAAELLRTTEAVVLELAEASRLPGRKLAGEWRFARAAILAWLGHA